MSCCALCLPLFLFPCFSNCCLICQWRQFQLQQQGAHKQSPVLMLQSWSCCDKHFGLNVSSLTWTSAGLQHSNTSQLSSGRHQFCTECVQQSVYSKGLTCIDGLFSDAFSNMEGCRHVQLMCMWCSLVSRNNELDLDIIYKLKNSVHTEGHLGFKMLLNNRNKTMSNKTHWKWFQSVWGRKFQGLCWCAEAHGDTWNWIIIDKVSFTV